MPIIKLESNQPPKRFYRGGQQIRDFRRINGTATHEPEDWLASTSTIFGEPQLGLSLLPNGVWLKDEIERDPISYLGTEHVDHHGANPLLLTKLLDAGERLPVHFHPDRMFASTHLGLPHGKHEAWYMLNSADVYVGFRKDTTLDDVLELISSQEPAALLGALNQVRVHRGDTVYIPAGVPHAIGAGAFLVEVQQPTDQSVLMEWRSFDIEESNCFLGLELESALSDLHRAALTQDDLATLLSRRSADARPEALASNATAYFRIAEHDAHTSAAIDRGYQVLVITEGWATMRESGEDLRVERGDALLVPHSAQAIWGHRSEEFEAISCRPPAV